MIPDHKWNRQQDPKHHRKQQERSVTDQEPAYPHKDDPDTVKDPHPAVFLVPSADIGQILLIRRLLSGIESYRLFAAELCEPDAKHDDRTYAQADTRKNS